MTQPPQITGKGGRPKRQFTDNEIALIEEYARINCYNRTIATAINIPIVTLERRFGTKIRRWRAQGKVELRQMQRKLAQTSPDMSKFLGKNDLEQVDKHVEVVEPIVQAEPLTDLEIKELKRLAGLASNIKIKPLEGLQGAG